MDMADRTKITFELIYARQRELSSSILPFYFTAKHFKNCNYPKTRRHHRRRRHRLIINKITSLLQAALISIKTGDVSYNLFCH